MDQEETTDTGSDKTINLEDDELLHARRKRLAEKLRSRGLILPDTPPAEDDEEQNPAEA